MKRNNATFTNQIRTEMDTRITTSISILRKLLKGNSTRRPSQPMPVERLDSQTLQTNKQTQQTRVAWFGHSAFLLELDGQIILLDPMFGKYASPVPLSAMKRFSTQLPIEIKDLPPIDAVLLSHDHYDHLDSGTIKQLNHKVGQFIVPLGVGSHLQRWGVSREKIQEHNWWDEFDFEGLRLACTPARHFSGRGLHNRNSTLWCSWVITGLQANIYFSGDSGYGPHFKEIGEKYGPFDLTLLECGQYDKRWSAIHMVPEQTVQAQIDLKGKLLLPIHWAGFTLALHAWTDPVERVTKAAHERGLAVTTPRIGESVLLGSTEYPTSTWWRNL